MGDNQWVQGRCAAPEEVVSTVLQFCTSHGSHVWFSLPYTLFCEMDVMMLSSSKDFCARKTLNR